MIAQIANGGFKIKPSFNANDQFLFGDKIIQNDDDLKLIQDALDVATNSGAVRRIVPDLKEILSIVEKLELLR